MHSARGPGQHRSEKEVQAQEAQTHMRTRHVTFVGEKVTSSQHVGFEKVVKRVREKSLRMLRARGQREEVVVARAIGHEDRMDVGTARQGLVSTAGSLMKIRKTVRGPSAEALKKQRPVRACSD